MNRNGTVAALFALLAGGTFLACSKGGGSSSSSGGGTPNPNTYDGTWTLSVGADGGGLCPTGFTTTTSVTNDGADMAGGGISFGGMTSGANWGANTAPSATDNCLNGGGMGTCSSYAVCSGTWTFTSVNGSRTATATVNKQ